MRKRLIWATLAVVAVSVLALGLPLMIVTVRLVADGVRTELLARVRALLRRSHGETGEEEELHAQDVRVDVSAHRAFQGDRELHLTTKEFDLLRVLVQNAGSVVVRDTLMRDVWGSDPVGSTKTLDMHVSWLRRKLGDDANAPRYVSTVRGLCFRFEIGAS